MEDGDIPSHFIPARTLHERSESSDVHVNMDEMMETFMMQASFMRNAFAKIIDTVIVVMNTTTQDEHVCDHIFIPKR